MVFLPSAILLLAAATMAVWRRISPRMLYLVEVGGAFAALGAALVLARIEPPDVVLALSFDGAQAYGLRFAPSSDTKVLLVGLTAWVAASALGRRWTAEALGRSAVASWLAHAAIIGLGLMAANIPALLLGWTAIGISEHWLSRPRGASVGGLAGPVIAGADVLVVVLVLSAAVLGVVQSTGVFVSLSFLALLTAAVVRVVASERAAETLREGPGPQASDIAVAGAIPAFAVLSMWASGDGNRSPMPLLPFVCALLALTAAAFHWGGSQPSGRRRSWFTIWFALALAAGTPGMFGGAGAAMVLGVGLWPAGTSARAVHSARTLLGGMLAIGVPYLVGAVVLAGIGEISSPVRIVLMMAMGLSVSRFWRDLVVRPPSSSGRDGTRATTIPVVLSTVVLAGAAAWSYVALRPAEPPWIGAAVVLVASAVGAIGFRLARPGNLERLERALQWPETRGVRQGVNAALDAGLRGARAVRDVLEGDASLLWAFVIVLIGLVLLGRPA